MARRTGFVANGDSSTKTIEPPTSPKLTFLPTLLRSYLLSATPQIEPDTALEQAITIITPADIASVDVLVLDDPSPTKRWIPFRRRPRSGGRWIHEGIIPEDVVREQRLLTFHLRAPEGVTIRELPADGPMRCHGCDLWWVNGQWFLYNPGDFFSPPRVEEFELQPRNFLPRRVRVQLPRCYELNRPKRYPVVYFLDGQNIFSPGSQFGSWDADLTATRLMRRTDTPEMIIVTIDNTSDRHIEYVPEYGRLGDDAGRGGEFLRMLGNELIPRINKDFRTLATPDSTALIGSSLGGLLAWFAARDASHLFGICGAISPSMWVNIPENERRARMDPQTFSRLWMDSGGPDQGDGYERTLRVRDILLRHGHSIGRNFMYQVEPDHSHNEADWAKRLPAILQWMFAPEDYAEGSGNWQSGGAA